LPADQPGGNRGSRLVEIVIHSMATKAAPKTTGTGRALPASPSGAQRGHYPDLDDWPRSWMRRQIDLRPGEKLVVCFRPFLEDHLVCSDLSRRTIRKHVENLWMLGGEIIRNLNRTPRLRKMAVERLLFDIVDDGGPLLYHGGSEEQQRSLESTCKKFRRFLRHANRRFRPSTPR